MRKILLLQKAKAREARRKRDGGQHFTCPYPECWGKYAFKRAGDFDHHVQLTHPGTPHLNAYDHLEREAKTETTDDRALPLELRSGTHAHTLPIVKHDDGKPSADEEGDVFYDAPSELDGNGQYLQLDSIARTNKGLAPR